MEGAPTPPLAQFKIGMEEGRSWGAEEKGVGEGEKTEDGEQFKSSICQYRNAFMLAVLHV